MIRLTKLKSRCNQAPETTKVIRLPKNGDYCYSISREGVRKYAPPAAAAPIDTHAGIAPPCFELYALQLGNNYERIVLEKPNIVIVTVGGHLIRALVDTGANINVIPQHLLNVLPKHAYRQYRGDQVNCHLANDAVVPITSRADLHVRIGGTTHHVRTYVLPRGKTLILGLEFLQHTQSILDCVAAVLYIQRDPTLKYGPPPLENTLGGRVATVAMLQSEESDTVSTTLDLIELYQHGEDYTPYREDDRTDAQGWESSPAELADCHQELLSVHMCDEKPPYPRPSRYQPLTWDLSSSSLNPVQQYEMIRLLTRNRAAFAMDMSELGHCHLVEVELSLIPEARPKAIKPYKESLEQQRIIQEQIDKWLKYDIIAEGESDWRHSLLLVKKPHTANQYRVCSDVRYLNSNTISYHYPMPDLNKILAGIGQGGTQYFTKLDLGSAYHQMDMHPTSMPLTGFSCSAGYYWYKRCCFGLKNLPAVFTKLMDVVLGDAQHKYAAAFIDDIIVYSATFTEHLVHVEDVLQRLQRAGLTASPSKTSVAVPEVTYIGHRVGRDGVTADGENIAKIRDCVSPTSLKECRQLIGLLAYYRRLIANFAILCRPLHDCTKKDNDPFIWSAEAETNFRILRQKLIEAPIVGLPDFQSANPFLLYCDASNIGCGYTLTQVQPDPKQPAPSPGGAVETPTPVRYIERVILYGGAAWTDAQRKYPTIVQEMLAIVVACRYLHPYLFNRLTILYTDCKSLKYIFHNTKILNDKILRWVLTLSQYRLLILHIAGKLNVTSDFLSRMPQDNTVTAEDVLRVPLYAIYHDPVLDPKLACARSVWQHLNVYHGDIVNFKCDMMVNATNTRLEPRGGVDRAIQYAAGPDMLNHCQELGRCELGHVVVTPGYLLPCLFVAHAVGPTQHDAAAHLTACYERCFEAAVALECKSIAFPCISCGVFGFNKDAAVKIALQTAIKFLQEATDPISVTYVIYGRDTDQLRRYNNLLAHIQMQEGSSAGRPPMRENPLDPPDTLQGPWPVEVLQERALESTEDTTPILSNFGTLYPVPKGSSLKDTMEWSDALEAELIKHEPVNDEVCVIDLPYQHVIPSVPPYVDKYKLNMREVGREQLNDPEWKHRVLRVQNGTVPEDMSKRELHTLLCTMNDYVLDPQYGVLHRLWNKSQQRGSSLVIQQLCLPEKYHKAIIANAHQNGHFGALKVYLQLRETYYWQTMFQDIKDFLPACRVCQYANSKTTRRAPLNPAPVPEGPFCNVHLDILRMSTTSNGYQYVAVMIDAFSRLTRCVPVRTKTAENTANAFYHGWLSVYGAPLHLSLVTDNGLEYKGAVFQCLTKAYGLKSKWTNYYSPSTNGMCERVNRTILAVLRRLTDNHPKDWSVHLDSCTNAINSTVCTSTGVSPFELIHGIKIRLPNQIVLPQVNLDMLLNEKEAVAVWRSRLRTLREEAVLLMTNAQNEQKKHYDAKTSPPKFQVGDICARLVERLPVDGSKMAHRYQGTYEIRRFTSVTNVELYDVESQQIHPRYLHVNKLKRIHPGRQGPECYDGLVELDANHAKPAPSTRPAVPQQTGQKHVTETLRRMTRSQTLAEQIERFQAKVNLPADCINESAIVEANRDKALRLADSQELLPEQATVTTRKAAWGDPTQFLGDTLALDPALLRTPAVPASRSDFSKTDSDDTAAPADDVVPTGLANPLPWSTLRPEPRSNEIGPSPKVPYRTRKYTSLIPRRIRFEDEAATTVPPPEVKTPPRAPSPDKSGRMETCQSDSDAECSDSGSSLTAIPPDEPPLASSRRGSAEFFKIKKIYRKRATSTGDVEYKVQWADFPAKKHSSWVPAEMFSPASQEQIRVRQRLRSQSANAAVPNHDTAPPAASARSRTPPLVGQHEPDPNSEVRFTHKSRRGDHSLRDLDDTVPLTREKFPSDPPAKPVTSTPADHRQVVELEDWDVTGLPHPTESAAASPTGESFHTPARSSQLAPPRKSDNPPTVNNVMFNADCAEPIHTYQVLLQQFLATQPILTRFLDLPFTTELQKLVMDARNTSSEPKEPQLWLYQHTTHPFASFYNGFATDIYAPVREMGEVTTKAFAHLENMFQYYKARVAGNLPIALECARTSPVVAKTRTNKQNLTMNDLSAWDNASFGAMIECVAANITSRPALLGILLQTAGKYTCLLGESRKWCAGLRPTSSAFPDGEYGNQHGAAYGILRELYLLAHTGAYSIQPYTLLDDAWSNWPDHSVDHTMPASMRDDGERLAHQLQRNEVKLSYLFHRYTLRQMGYAAYCPLARDPVDCRKQMYDPLKLGRQLYFEKGDWIMMNDDGSRQRGVVTPSANRPRKIRSHDPEECSACGERYEQETLV